MKRSTQLSKWAGITAGATFVLVVLGGVVRATGSGLGCPDWPTCYGSWIPPFERTAIIEYTHRSVAALVGLLVAVVVVLAWRQRAKSGRNLAAAGAALLLVSFQAWAGRQVVLGELDPSLVTVHLTTAMLFLAVLLFLTLCPSGELPPAAQVRMYWVAAAGVFLVIVVGALVRGEDAGLVFPDWPLMDGGLIPARLTTSIPRLAHFLHRVLALVVGVYLTYVAVRVGRDPQSSTTARRLIQALLAVYVGQSVVGALNIWYTLHPLARVAHLSLATLAWVLVLAPLLLTSGELDVVAAHPTEDPVQ